MAALSARSRPSAAPTLLVALAALGCAGCGGGQDLPRGSSPVPVCTPLPSVSLVLEGKAAVFELSDLAEPTDVVERDGYLVISARAAGEIPELAIAFQHVVTDAGFDIAGTDDEGFEAEVFFARGNTAAGQVVLSESACPGLVEVRISVLDDPAVLPDVPGAPPSATATP